MDWYAENAHYVYIAGTFKSGSNKKMSQSTKLSSGVTNRSMTKLLIILHFDREIDLFIIIELVIYVYIPHNRYFKCSNILIIPMWTRRHELFAYYIVPCSHQCQISILHSSLLWTHCNRSFIFTFYSFETTFKVIPVKWYEFLL